MNDDEKRTTGTAHHSDGKIEPMENKTVDTLRELTFHKDGSPTTALIVVFSAVIACAVLCALILPSLMRML